MALPEREKPDPSPSSSKAQWIEALADIDRQLETAEAHENPIERFFKREQLLEQRDFLEGLLIANGRKPTLRNRSQ